MIAPAGFDGLSLNILAFYCFGRNSTTLPALMITGNQTKKSGGHQAIALIVCQLGIAIGSGLD